MMRRTIAKRLVQSKGPVPHFYLTVDVAMDRTWEAWRALREEQSAVSLNDVIIKVTAAALRRHPEMNASFGGDHVKRYARVHVGVAVAVEDGLITPVVRDADAKSIEEIAGRDEGAHRAGPRAAAAARRVHRRHLLDVEPRHVRHRGVLGDHQPARGRPSSRSARCARCRWWRTAASGPAGA